MSYLVSTKGRYALRIMLDLSENGQNEYTPLKGIAERQDISLKYMETIMPGLVKAGLVTAVPGKSGGYKLSRPVSEYTVGEILNVTEGELAPVACLASGYVCPRADTCRTLPLWQKMDSLIKNYLATVKLTDLLSDDGTNEYCI